jgi:hypothetical protein
MSGRYYNDYSFHPDPAVFYDSRVGLRIAVGVAGVALGIALAWWGFRRAAKRPS